MRRRVSSLEWLALAAALTPLVVGCVWALSVGWIPLGDSGQLVVRSRDVLTADQPFVGAWSSSSQIFKTDINNLGSLYSLLLAPFTKVDPYGGAAVGATAINAGAVSAAWLAARSLLDQVGAVVAMFATLVLIASMGVVSLLEARQQIALVLPFWALLWATAALWSGRLWAAPGVVFLASLVAQTHFTYLQQAVALAVAGAVGAAFSRRRRGWDGSVAPLLAAAAVGVACWTLPMWDQVFGRGNLKAVLAQGGRGGTGTPGWAGSAHLISRAGLRYPFVLPGSMGSYRPFSFAVDRPGIGTWVSLAVWFAAVILVFAWAHLTHRRSVAALAGTAMLALGVAWYVAGQIPRYGPSYPPQNYYWMWPTVLVALCTGVVAAWRKAIPALSGARRIVSRAVVAVLVVAALGSSWPTGALSGVSASSFHRRAAGRSFVVQVAAWLDGHRIDGPVVIDYRRDSAFSDHRYTFLAELQRRGLRFTFLGDDVSTFRFGRRRCADDKVRYRFSLVSGKVALKAPEPEARLIARVDASPDQYRALARLDGEAADMLRSGAIGVDVAALAESRAEAAAEVSRLLMDPGRSAVGLGPTLWFEALFGHALTASAREQAFLDRWNKLQLQVWQDRAALFVAREDPDAVRPPCP